MVRELMLVLEQRPCGKRGLRLAHRPELLSMLNATETAGLGRRRFRLGIPARDTLPVPKESAFDTFAARLQMGVGAAFAGKHQRFLVFARN